MFKSFFSLFVCFVNLLVCCFADLDSIFIEPSVLVLLLEDTGGRIKRNILDYYFVAALVPCAVRTALVFALLAVFCFCGYVH